MPGVTTIADPRLRLKFRTLELRVTRPGRLLPWLGPAIRGAVARQFKDAVCVWPIAQRESRWKYCQGCPAIADCGYGSTFEPDPIPGREIMGSVDGQRAVTIVPRFPARQRAREGDVIPVRIVLLGNAAIDAEQELASAIDTVLSMRGLGMDGVTFSAKEARARPSVLGERVEIAGCDLPIDPLESHGVVPWVRLALASPLFLKGAHGSGKSRPVFRPTFAQLFRASLRVVGRAFASFGTASLDQTADFRELKLASTHVETAKSDWRPFRQRHASSRSQNRWQLRGVQGSAVFRDVPLSLLPWLMWGGRLGVGEFRVAGAGTWTLQSLAQPPRLTAINRQQISTRGTSGR